MSLGEPRVSVVIATRNRADLLEESLESVVHQTWGDLEIVVVDDGSTDGTAQLVRNHPDPRVRYVRSRGRGISAARNTGSAEARGEWIAVHDDDDIMLPDRLARQMEKVGPGVDFIHAAYVDFDDKTGEMRLHPGRELTYGTALPTGYAPGHSTWLVRARLMRSFGYDEGLESAVDNNLALRMLRSGVRFRHSGNICVLRRVHGGAITQTGYRGQKYVAGLDRDFLRHGFTDDHVRSLWERDRDLWGLRAEQRWESRCAVFLPDRLIHRSGVVAAAPDDEGVVLLQDARSMDRSEILSAAVARAGLDGVTAHLRSECALADHDLPDGPDVVELLRDHLIDTIEATPPGIELPPFAVVCVGAGPDDGDAFSASSRSSSVLHSVAAKDLEGRYAQGWVRSCTNLDDALEYSVHRQHEGVVTTLLSVEPTTGGVS
ncbi:glycosyltransferase family 2 protein [Brevibacterium litoralis]|uniref:glycosyltransferase family 2 protein n=1 Tax=Brevibacterium litoralis TaxID=3138935 RepID=UPI0032EDD0F9